MAERERDRPGEAVVQRWSDEDEDDWGEFRLEDLRVVYPRDIDPGDVSGVRRALGMSEAEFASALGISISTLRQMGAGPSRAARPGASTAESDGTRAGGGTTGIGRLAALQTHDVARDPPASLDQPFLGYREAEADMAGGRGAEGVARQEGDVLGGQEAVGEVGGGAAGAADVEHHEHAAGGLVAADAGQVGEVARATVSRRRRKRSRMVASSGRSWARAAVAASWMKPGEP